MQTLIQQLAHPTVVAVLHSLNPADLIILARPHLRVVESLHLKAEGSPRRKAVGSPHRKAVGSPHRKAVASHHLRVVHNHQTVDRKEGSSHRLQTLK